MSHHAANCPCSACSDAEDAYDRFIERCEAKSMSEWEIIDHFDDIDDYTSEVQVESDYIDNKVIAKGITVHGELVEVYDFEVLQCDPY